MKLEAMLKVVEKLERASDKGQRFCIVDDPPTPAQVEHIRALEGEGYRVTHLRNPYAVRAPEAA